jgi:hypothetical protein
MLVGTMKGGDLLARIGEEQDAAALKRPGASRMNFTGREMKGFVVVAPEALDGAALRGWIGMARNFVKTLPPKQKAAVKKAKK